MTTIESAIYNRISSKCHAYVQHYFPTEYKKLALAAEEEYKNRKFRQNSLADIQKILKPTENQEFVAKNSPAEPDDNYWNDPEFAASYQEKEDESIIL